MFLATKQTNTANPGYVTLQLSFSTADVQRSVFYGKESTLVPEGGPQIGMTLLVVNGEVRRLEDAAPEFSIPFTPQAGLMDLIGLDQKK